MSATPFVTDPQSKVLRGLYLKLFLRGRTSRGLDSKQLPKSGAKRLAMTMLFYALIGCICLVTPTARLFSLSLYLHASTLMFIGMFIASSAGEVLFNKDEAEILLHRPVNPRAMLWAKISVLLQVSLLLAVAFNVAGMGKGSFTGIGHPLYALAHALSTVVEAFFCTGTVVVVYQLCLKWFGREKLDGLMTTAQVVMTLVIVGGSQASPHLARYLPGNVEITQETWWFFLLPPAWFSGLDEVLMGRATASSWALAGCGVAVTCIALALAFGKLANSYQSGLRMLNEEKATKPQVPGKARILERLLALPPLHWWLRHPLERSGFLLTAAYMLRDRDVKLRLYPGIAPMMMMPAIFLLNGARGRADDFMILMAGCYLPLLPIMAMNLLKYSQDWQATDVFHATPIAGPGHLIIGARKAVACLLVVPAILVVAAVCWWMTGDFRSLESLLPGLLALPFYSRILACTAGHLPLSAPGEQAKSAGRGAAVMLGMLSAFALGGVATAAKYFGFLHPLLGIEFVLACGIAVLLDIRTRRLVWAAQDD
jgi:ABC-2 type transport system permease protein